MARLITQKQVENTWESGLCNCCGDKEHSGEQCRFFCCALWCQCCAQGEMQQSSGLSDGCCIPCLFYSCTSTFSNLIPCIAMCNLHNSVAHASGINESTFCSCLKVCFCTACALNQVHSQLLLTGKSSLQTLGRSSCARGRASPCLNKPSRTIKEKFETILS